MDAAVNNSTKAAVNKIDAEHYDKYRRLIYKTAQRLYPQLLAFEPSAEFNDVVGMLNEVYAKCVTRFDASKGFNFTTYLTRACFNEFNGSMDKLRKERSVVSQVSMQQIGDAGDGESYDSYELFEDEATESPEDVLERRQEQVKLALALSPVARKVTALLIRQPQALVAFHESQPLPPQRKNRPPLTLDVICSYLQLSQAQVCELRTELRELIGVDFDRLNKGRFPLRAARPAFA